MADSNDIVRPEISDRVWDTAWDAFEASPRVTEYDRLLDALAAARPLMLAEVASDSAVIERGAETAWGSDSTWAKRRFEAVLRDCLGVEEEEGTG